MIILKIYLLDVSIKFDLKFFYIIFITLSKENILF